MTKAELRKLYLQKRRSIPAVNVLYLNEHIAWKFFENVDLTHVKSFHTYIRIEKFSEVDTSMIYDPLRRSFPKVKTFAPRVDVATGKVDDVAFDTETELYMNEWGILEPVTGEIVDASEIDLALVPLVAFDRVGHRVGYGKGFYDRFLVRCRPDCLKVGLSFFPPVERIDDIDEHDVRLDLCVTPDEVFDFRTTSAT